MRRDAFELFDFFDLFSQETEDFRGVFDSRKLIKRARRRPTAIDACDATLNLIS